MVPQWMSKPEVILSMTLFVIGTTVSLYRTEIRSALTIPGRKWKEFRIAFKRVRLEGHQTELTSLQYMHENAYRIVLYVLINVFSASHFIAVGFFGIFVLHFLFILFGLRKLGDFPAIPYAGGVGGLLSGRVVHIYERLHGLWDYNARCQTLEQKISKLKAELELAESVLPLKNR